MFRDGRHTFPFSFPTSFGFGWSRFCLFRAFSPLVFVKFSTMARAALFFRGMVGCILRIRCCNVYELCCCRFLHHHTKICLKLYKIMFIPCNKCRFTRLMVIPRICWSYILKKMSTHSTIALISLIFATLSIFSECHAGHVTLIDYESRLPYARIFRESFFFDYSPFGLSLSHFGNIPKHLDTFSVP